MNASKVLARQGLLLASLAAILHLAQLATFTASAQCHGAVTAWCLAGATLSIALAASPSTQSASRRRFYGALCLGSGVFGVGFLPSIVRLGEVQEVDEVSSTLGLLARVVPTAAAIALVGVVAILVDDLMRRRKAEDRMSRPLQLVSLALAIYVFARILARSVAVLTQSALTAASGGVGDAVYDTLLLSLAAVGYVLAVIPAHAGKATKAGQVKALAYGLGGILLAAASSAACVGGDSRGVLAGATLGIALVVPSFAPVARLENGGTGRESPPSA